MFLQFTEERQKELGVFHTHNEISQQPRLWLETYNSIYHQKEKMRSFLQGVTEKHNRVRVILTGAGTSAFVGDVVAPYLNKVCDEHVFSIESIATTNIVSNPTNYLNPETPTIMVSFARSGNSPESVAAVELGEKIIKDFYQIHITCNKDGFLAKKAERQEDSLLLLMPEESNDQGFAMTSSFTCMMLGALLVFQVDVLDDLENTVQYLSNNGASIIANAHQELEKIAALPFTNIIYLGSGPLLGLSHEASLKMLELTDGGVFTYYESPLGFRHGPKTLINPDSLAVVFISDNPYTQKYDLDILKELYQEKARIPLKVMSISRQHINEVKENSDFYFYQEKSMNEQVDIDDVWSAFLFILYAQMMAVYKSLHLGFTPDNPVPSGSVNRVVQGVNIHPFQ